MLMETADVRVLRLEVKGFFWGALFWCSVLNSSQNWKHRGYRERQRERERERVRQCVCTGQFFFFLISFTEPSKLLLVFERRLLICLGRCCIHVSLLEWLLICFLFSFLSFPSFMGRSRLCHSCAFRIFEWAADGATIDIDEFLFFFFFCS